MESKLSQITELNAKLHAQNKTFVQTIKDITKIKDQQIVDLSTNKQFVEELEKSKSELTSQLSAVQESILPYRFKMRTLIVHITN